MKALAREVSASGVTMVELLMVALLVLVALVPIFNFLITTHSTTLHGAEKLGLLETARFALEYVQRDLKALVQNDFVPDRPPTALVVIPNGYAFLTYPIGGDGFKDFASARKIPLNFVTYILEKGVLIRVVKKSPLLGGKEERKVLGATIAEFTIDSHVLFGIQSFYVRVKCESPKSAGKSLAVVLQTAVRSEYQVSLANNSHDIPNFSPQKVPPTN